MLLHADVQLIGHVVRQSLIIDRIRNFDEVGACLTCSESVCDVVVKEGIIHWPSPEERISITITCNDHVTSLIRENQTACPECAITEVEGVIQIEGYIQTIGCIRNHLLRDGEAVEVIIPITCSKDRDVWDVSGILDVRIEVCAPLSVIQILSSRDIIVSRARLRQIRNTERSLKGEDSRLIRNEEIQSVVLIRLQDR